MVENVSNIEMIEDISALDFSQHVKLMLALQEKAEKFPDAANYLLPNFYRLLEGKGTSSDMLPTAADIFASISKHLSPAQIAEAIQTIHNLGKDIFIERGASYIVKQNSLCAEPIFN